MSMASGPADREASIISAKLLRGWLRVELGRGESQGREFDEELLDLRTSVIATLFAESDRREDGMLWGADGYPFGIRPGNPDWLLLSPMYSADFSKGWCLLSRQAQELLPKKALPFPIEKENIDFYPEESEIRSLIFQLYSSIASVLEVDTSELSDEIMRLAIRQIEHTTGRSEALQGSGGEYVFSRSGSVFAKVVQATEGRTQVIFHNWQPRFELVLMPFSSEFDDIFVSKKKAIDKASAFSAGFRKAKNSLWWKFKSIWNFAFRRRLGEMEEICEKIDDEIIEQISELLSRGAAQLDQEGADISSLLRHTEPTRTS